MLRCELRVAGEGWETSSLGGEATGRAGPVSALNAVERSNPPVPHVVVKSLFGDQNG